jgi:hypothetical protein
MDSQPVSPGERRVYEAVLDAFPGLRAARYDFVTLMDARSILQRAQPPTGMQAAVCDYLDRTARALLRATGLPDDWKATW